MARHLYLHPTEEVEVLFFRELRLSNGGKFLFGSLTTGEGRQKIHTTFTFKEHPIPVFATPETQSIIERYADFIIASAEQAWEDYKWAALMDGEWTDIAL